jgi:CRISPR-associated protein Cas1
VRIQMVTGGYDPTIGLLRSGRVGRGQHDFVLDLMEPLRPIADRKVLDFVQAHTFHPSDFTIRSDGVCRLNPEMGRQVVRVSLNCLADLRAFRPRATQALFSATK